MTNTPAFSKARPKAIIVGGFLGGLCLFAANLLTRNGWDVDVFERVPEELAGRRAGIVTHPELLDALTSAGVQFDDSIGVKVLSRVTFGQDGGVLSERSLPQTLTARGGRSITSCARLCWTFTITLAAP